MKTQIIFYGIYGSGHSTLCNLFSNGILKANTILHISMRIDDRS